jgi:hypothetical protein
MSAENVEVVAPVAEAAPVDPSVADLAAYRASLETPPAETPAAETPAAPVVEAVAGEIEPDPASEAGKALASKKKSLQARIDAMAAERAQTQRERDAIAAEAAALRAELVALRAPKQPAAEAPAVQATRPKPTEEQVGTTYPTYADFVEDLAEWKSEQRDARRQAEAATTQQTRQEQAEQAAFQQRATTWAERREAFAASTPAFVEKAVPFLDHVFPGTPIGDVIMESAVGPQLALYLAENEAEVRRIIALHPLTQLRELGKIEAKLEPAAPAAAPAAPVVSKAPAPVRPIAGTPAASTPDPKTMNSVAEWRKHRAEFGG